MPRFLINCWTAWCGEDETFAAIADYEEQLSDVLDNCAYDNYLEGTGPDGILTEVYPDIDPEDLTDEERDEALENEGGYYGGSIEEWDETRPEEEWGWYELVYDINNHRDNAKV